MFNFGNMDFGNLMGAIQNNSRLAGYGTAEQQANAGPKQSLMGAFQGQVPQAQMETGGRMSDQPSPFYAPSQGNQVNMGDNQDMFRGMASPMQQGSSIRNVAFRRTPYGDGPMANRDAYFDMADQGGYRVPEFATQKVKKWDKKHPNTMTGGAIDNPMQGGGGTSYRDAFQYFGGQPQQPQQPQGQFPSWLQQLLNQGG